MLLQWEYASKSIFHRFYKGKLQKGLLLSFYDFHACSLKMMLKISCLDVEARLGVVGLGE